jgi:hypothetical protein
MGIIDKKSRILDTIITQEGRRQIAQGKLRIEYVSFTDGDAFYEKDILSGTTDPSSRIYFEATSLPQDQITFEADDSGKLMPYIGNQLGVVDGKIFSGSSDAYLTIITGSTFASLSDELLGSTVENFRKLLAIRTDDVFFDEEREFTTNTNVLEFSITENSPFQKNEVKDTTINHVESLFQDKRLSHLPNFKYLPPINKTSNLNQQSLGYFPPIGQRTSTLTYEELLNDLKNKEKQTIEFNSTKKNNLVSQIFEVKQNMLQKLDVIDFGTIATNDEISVEKRIFFVGKVFIDDRGAQTFVNIFTLVFE